MEVQNKMIDKEVAFVNILATELEGLFGKDCWDDSALHTAHRIVKAWSEFIPPTEPSFKCTTFDATGLQQLIVAKDLEFSSMCSHHLFPVWGYAHVGYLPHTKMVGLSKIPRIVDHFTRRPVTQEWATIAIADYLKETLEARGVAVILEARHTCMACRGVGKHQGAMVTSMMKGEFMTNGTLRQEFLTLIQRDGL